MTGNSGADGPVFFDLRGTDAWLVSGVRRMGAIVDGDDRRTLRKLKALVELLFWESHVVSKPSLALLRVLRAKLTAESAQLLHFFWHHLETDTLARVCLGMMSDLGVIAKDHPVRRATLFELSRTYHEQLPFRALDAAHSTWKFQVGSIFRSTFNARHRFEGHLVPRTLDDEYALTHTIFYLTDFGRNPEALKAKAQKVGQRLKLLAAEAHTSGNLDILAEHLLCLRFIGRIEPMESTWYSQELIRQRIGYSYWQGPLQLKRKLLSEGFGSEQLQFFENYHTTLLIRDVLLGGSCGRVSKVEKPRTASSRPWFATRPELVTLQRLLNRRSFSASSFCQELTDPGSIQLNLMALSRWTRRGMTTQKALPEHVTSLISAVSEIPHKKKDFSLALTVALARDIRSRLSSVGGGTRASYDLPRLEKIARSLLSGQLASPHAQLTYNACAEVVCIAALELAPGRIPIFWSTAVLGMLHRAVRLRDVVNTSYLLWAADAMSLAVDREIAFLGLNLVRFYEAQTFESTLLPKAARMAKSLLRSTSVPSRQMP